MNETMEVILGRRSIRKYRDTQIEEKALQAILEAAIHAPSARNQQKWHFSVIQNKEVMDKMVEIIKKNMMNSGIPAIRERVNTPDYHTFYHAPTVILISGSEAASVIDIDGALAAGNIALAAESLDIGSCIITLSKFLFASEEGNQMKETLQIPPGYKHICTVALGYRSGSKPAVPPKNGDVVSYIR